MKRTLFALLVVAVAAGGYYYHSLAAKPQPPQIVQTSLSTGDIVEAVQITGILQPLQTVNVGSQVSGVVAELGADFDSIVKKGQVIARLDPSLLQAQVDLQVLLHDDCRVQRKLAVRLPGDLL